MKEQLVALVTQLKSERRRIAAYGASAKGSTLLNYFGLGSAVIDYVVDRSSAKQGRYTPGTHLKIFHPDKLLEDQPDFVLLLTWNFAEEILAQQAELSPARRQVHRSHSGGARGMIFTPTGIDGVFVVSLEPVEDERGCFARTWCAEEFARHGLDAQLAQCSLSCSRVRGTVRGMHYQVAPYEESKLVRVTRGAAFDVAVDIRGRSRRRLASGWASSSPPTIDSALFLSRRLCPRPADSGRRHGSAVSDVRSVRAWCGAWHSVGRCHAQHRLAVAGQVHLRTRSRATGAGRFPSQPHLRNSARGQL